MGRDNVQLETVVSTITQEYLLEFTSEYGISEALHPELPGLEDRIVDFPEGKIRLSQLTIIGATKGVPNYCGLAYKCSEGRDAIREYVFPRSGDDTEHTSYPNPETTRSTTLLGRVEPHILPGRRDMDLFNLIRAPNPTKVKTGSRPRAAHEVSLLTVTANRVIEIEDLATETDSSGNVTTTRIAPEAGQAERVAATGPPVVKERRKRSHDGVDTNAPPKVPRRDHADPRPIESTRGGKSLAAIELGMGSTRPVLAPQGAPVDVSDPDPLSFVDPPSRPSADVTQELLRPEIQNQIIHRLPPWSGLLKAYIGLNEQYNVNLARQVAMGSQLRLRFEQEAKLLKKSVAQVALRDKRIRARENEIKNLETLLEAEANTKKTAENKSAELSAELENMRALFSDLQVSNNRLSQQVSTLQAQVMGEEKLKAAFEEFKKNEHDLVEQRCAEIDVRLDALSIDFDEELYLHMLTVIAGHRWVIGRGLRLVVMKCGEPTELRQAFADVVSAAFAKGMSEGLMHGVEHGKAKLDLEAIEAYHPEAEAKYIAALHALKNLKYPLVDQLESLKDAPMDVIMASLHLESDTGDDAPQWIHELRPSSSQLTIPVYPEARDPMDPWACKEEILLACYCGQR
nr:hypothetical protein [Tanacetum cinerariifolium]